ncbi:MAG: hypothetical protein Q4B16_09095, partial [Bacteroidia bacterium]|nr:hypothetical protein [Bacteroidia bacterium]
ISFLLYLVISLSIVKQLSVSAYPKRAAKIRTFSFPANLFGKFLKFCILLWPEYVTIFKFVLNRPEAARKCLRRQGGEGTNTYEV